MKLKKILILFSVVIMVITTFAGCSQKASKYTEEQHMQRISERIQKRYIDGDKKIRNFKVSSNEEDAFMKPTGFEVYPLYDNNDELKYCVVEFHPYGYQGIWIRDEYLKALTWIGLGVSMYSLSHRFGVWKPCSIDKETGEIVFETENGAEKVCYHSPFTERGVLDEKKYLIRCKEKDNNNEWLIPAVKRNGKYLNLYSNEEFEVVDGRATEKIAVCLDSFGFINSREFDL